MLPDNKEYFALVDDIKRRIQAAQYQAMLHANAELINLYCLPFGGAKGAGLAMLMDMMAGMYTGSQYAGDVSSLYYRFEEPQNLGHMIFIMKADLFMPMDEYKKKMDIYYKRLKALPRAAGVDEILMPGEPEDRKTEQSRKEGILLSKNIQESLYAECLQRKVECSDILDTEDVDLSQNAGAVVFEMKK